MVSAAPACLMCARRLHACIVRRQRARRLHAAADVGRQLHIATWRPWRAACLGLLLCILKRLHACMHNMHSVQHSRSGRWTQRAKGSAPLRCGQRAGEGQVRWPHTWLRAAVQACVHACMHTLANQLCRVVGAAPVIGCFNAP